MSCMVALEEKVGKPVSIDIIVKLDKLIEEDNHIKEVVMENIVDFKQVLTQGTFKVDNYVNAVLFVSYYILGLDKVKAYHRVFKDKIDQLNKEGKPPKTISRIITAYYRTKIVQLLLAQVQMPAHVMFRSTYYKAIKKQVELMEDPKVSPIVQQKAADSLMGHLSEPETQKIEVTHEQGDSNRDLMRELLDTTEKLALRQLGNIKEGVTNAGEVAQDDILDAEFTEKSNED